MTTQGKMPETHHQQEDEAVEPQEWTVEEMELEYQRIFGMAIRKAGLD